jgi:glycosyltransferase involved in cell wall biosynthesis
MLSDEPLISVVVPTYNCGKYLKEAVDSIMRQSYINFEIIIVDDGSTDDTKEIVGGFNTTKIKYIYQENSGGPSRPRNIGIQNAAGDLISLFDSDDVMDSRKLEYAVKVFLKNPEVDFIFSNFNVINELGEILKNDYLKNYGSFRKFMTRINSCENSYHLSGDVYYELLVANFIGTSSVVFKKSIFAEIGCFDESLRCAEDIDFWYRAARTRKNFAYLDIIGHSYRRRESSITSSSSGNIQNILTVLDRQLNSADTKERRKQAGMQIHRVLLSSAWDSYNNKDYLTAKKRYKILLSRKISYLGLKGFILSNVLQLCR